MQREAEMQRDKETEKQSEEINRTIISSALDLQMKQL